MAARKTVFADPSLSYTIACCWDVKQPTNKPWSIATSVHPSPSLVTPWSKATSVHPSPSLVTLWSVATSVHLSPSLYTYQLYTRPGRVAPGAGGDDRHEACSPQLHPSLGFKCSPSEKDINPLSDIVRMRLIKTTTKMMMMIMMTMKAPTCVHQMFTCTKTRSGMYLKRFPLMKWPPELRHFSSLSMVDCDCRSSCCPNNRYPSR